MNRADDVHLAPLSQGLSQRGVRDHNERLLLSLLQRNGPQPASYLARQSHLSPPTISTILKRLETEGIVMRGDPRRGKVGKPSVPIALDPDGAFAIGVKIGRRSADILLLDVTGQIRVQRKLTYAAPAPDAIFEFLATGLADFQSGLSGKKAARICGIGVGAPSEMWSWHSQQDEQAQTMMMWRNVDFAERIGAFTDLPVTVINDATAACQAEHVFGQGKRFRDYVYFYVGAFVGGGVVLNNSIFEGRSGNAGALGSLRTVLPNGAGGQLIDTASIHLLENRLTADGLDARLLWEAPKDWGAVAKYVTPWLDQTARELAKASMSTCAVIDFEAVIIDGAFPANIRAPLVERVAQYAEKEDARGLIRPQILEGTVGSDARAIGAASAPISAQLFPNKNLDF